MDKNEQKAEELIKQAEKNLNKWSFFSSNNSKFYDAAELYKKAAIQFKIAKKDLKSGSAYKKSGELYIKADSNYDAGTCFASAAKAFGASNSEESEKMYQKAIEIFKEKNQFSAAARLHKEAAEIFKSAFDLKTAQSHFKAAAECFEVDNLSVSANQCLIESADCLARLKNFSEACSIYFDVAAKYKENKLLKWGIKDLYFKYFICKLAESAQSGKNINPIQILNNLAESNLAFSNSREFKFSQKLSETFENRDSENFSEAIYEIDEKLNLDDWKVSLLVGIKKELAKSQAPDHEVDFT